MKPLFRAYIKPIIIGVAILVIPYFLLGIGDSGSTGDITVSNNQSGGITAHTINISSGVEDRTLTDSLKNQILEELRKLGATSVAIHYEYDSETQQLAQSIGSFLNREDFSVVFVSHNQSGYPRNALAIFPSETDSNWALIRIGTR